MTIRLGIDTQLCDSADDRDLGGLLDTVWDLEKKYVSARQ